MIFIAICHNGKTEICFRPGKRIDQFDDVLPFDNEELFLQRQHLPSCDSEGADSGNQHSENGNFYEKLTACIEGLDSVSDSETSDSAEKSVRSSTTQNGVGDYRTVAQVLDEIVDKVVSMNESDDVFVGQNVEAGDKRTLDSTRNLAAKELRSILEQVGADNSKLQNLIKTFQQQYEKSTIEVSVKSCGI